MKQKLYNFEHVICKRSDDDVMHVYLVKRAIFTNLYTNNNDTNNLCFKTSISTTNEQHNDNYTSHNNVQTIIRASQHHQIASMPNSERANSERVQKFDNCSNDNNNHNNVAGKIEADDETAALEFFSE